MARRIESSPSQTADITCGCRALSFFEKNLLYKSNDWVAAKLLPKKIKIFLPIPLARKILSKILGRGGMYEWVIARTKYIDEAFENIKKEEFSQIIFFGAGFDSRGIRYKNDLEKVNIFELDAPATQEMKIKQFKLRGIEIPSNINFVPINFEKESIFDKLIDAGFKIGEKTLVILEGVLQYLNSESVYSTFDNIKDLLTSDSLLIFDYAHLSVLHQDSNSKDEAKLMRELKYFGESWQFGLDETEVEPLLNKYDFIQTDRKSPLSPGT